MTMGWGSSEELMELVAAAHHEIGNYLAAVRFAAELWRESPPGAEGAELPAESAERAARQAGLFLSLLRPLLRREAPARETLRADTLVDGLCREIAIHRAPIPERGTISDAPPRLLPRDDLHNGLVALCLAFENRDAPQLCVCPEENADGLRIELMIPDVRVDAAWASQDPPRGPALALRLVAASMARCGVAFRVVHAEPARFSWVCPA